MAEDNSERLLSAVRAVAISPMDAKALVQRLFGQSRNDRPGDEMVGGTMADTVVCMKLQVDMCMCMAETFGYDLHEPDAQHLAFLIAAGGALEKAGVDTGAKVASKAGVKMLQQYLKGTALQAVKAFFQKLGLVFTRKALERSLPFGIGVLLGSGGGYALTRYVGSQAKQWFLLDREARG